MVLRTTRSFPLFTLGILLFSSLSCQGLVESIDKAARKLVLEQKAPPTLTGLAGALSLGFQAPEILGRVPDALFASPSTGGTMAPGIRGGAGFSTLAEITGTTGTLSVTCDTGGSLKFSYAQSAVTSGAQISLTIEAQGCKENLKDGFLYPVSGVSSTVPDRFITLDGSLNLTALFPQGVSPDTGEPSEFSASAANFTLSYEDPVSTATFKLAAFQLTGKNLQGEMELSLNGTSEYEVSSSGISKGAKAVYTNFQLKSKELANSKAELTLSGKIAVTPTGTTTAQCTIGAYEVKTLAPLVVSTDQEGGCPEAGKLEVIGASEELHAIYIFAGSVITVQDPQHPDIETQVQCSQIDNNLKQCGLSE